MLRKRITLLERKPGMSNADFRAHWRAPHAALIVKLPGIREYVQNHVLDLDRMTPPLDGIVEVWFEEGDGAITPATHRSDEQEEDEKSFIGLLTGFTVLPSDPYPDSPFKVWLLTRAAPPEEIAGALAEGASRVLTATRDTSTGLMTRRALEAEPDPPTIFVTACYEDRDLALAARQRVDGLLGRLDTARAFVTETNRVQ